MFDRMGISTSQRRRGIATSRQECNVDEMYSTLYTRVVFEDLHLYADLCSAAKKDHRRRCNLSDCASELIHTIVLDMISHTQK